MKVDQTYASNREQGGATETRATFHYLVDRELATSGSPRSVRVEDHGWPFDNSGYWKVDTWLAASGWVNVVVIDERDVEDAEEALDVAISVLGWDQP